MSAAASGPSGWRAVASICRWELARVARDRLALFFVVVMPVVIIVIVGSTFGATGSRLTVGVVLADGTDAEADELSQAISTAVASSPALEVRAYEDLGDLRRDLRLRAISAGLVIESVADPVRFVFDPTSADAAAARRSVGAELDALSARWTAVDVVRATTGLDEAEADEIVADQRHVLGTVAVERQSTGSGRFATFSEFSYTAPANLVLFVFVNSLAVGGAIAESRRFGVLRRMLAAPVGPSTVLAGIGASRFVFALVQSVLILAVGSAFGVAWGALGGVVALVVSFALVATAAGLLLGASVRTADQATAIGIPLAIGLGMLGGCMWPLENVSPFMQSVGKLTPHAWAMDGWIALVFDGAPASAVAGDVAVLVGFATVLGLAATWRLRRALVH